MNHEEYSADPGERRSRNMLVVKDCALAPPSDAEASRFAGELAQELAAGRIELPAIPDVALRVGRALDDDRVNVARLEQIVAAEPVLAGRIVQLASSAALKGAGQGVRDLREAIGRVGYGMVRVVSLAYALAYLRKGGTRAELGVRLNELWQQSTLVAALARVVAQRVSNVNPEMAMLAGLLHGVGELYILSRVAACTSAAGADRCRELVAERGGQAARVILDSWGIDREISTAVARQSDPQREHAGPADLTDVLTVSVLLATYGHRPDALAQQLPAAAACRRVGLADGDGCVELIAASQPQVEAMRAALGY